MATGAPPRPTSEAPNAGGLGAVAAHRVKVPSTPHQVAERKRMRARSRSTTIRVATLWTRPADSRGMTLRHSTGRDLVAVEPVEDPAGLLGVDQAAVEVAPLLDGRVRWPAGVISWKTIRLTGTRGESTSERCQAIDSPSRSSSVAR